MKTIPALFARTLIEDLRENMKSQETALNVYVTHDNNLISLLLFMGHQKPLTDCRKQTGSSIHKLNENIPSVYATVFKDNWFDVSLRREVKRNGTVRTSKVY